MGVFDTARAAISSSLIEGLLSSPGSYWDNDEYWTLNPTRADGAIGSFSINKTGLWNDFATGESGDLITLVSAMRNISKKQAAEAIAKMGGAAEEEPVAKKKKKKVPPAQEVPENSLKLLNRATVADWIVQRHGKPVRGWTYRTAEGAPAFCVTRHEKPNGTKNILPWYFGEDGSWHSGQRYEHNRPLFNLHVITVADEGTPVLVVEGEKCAAIEIPGYILTTWSSGSSAVDRTDWAPLENRRVIVWPDADAPGAKAAQAIKRRLPGAKILRVHGKPSGWDLADAVAEGVDPLAFIDEGVNDQDQEEGQDSPGAFLCLGYDAAYHYFIPTHRGQFLYKIGIGSFNSSKIGSLAPISFWAAQNMTTDSDGIKVALAQDFIENASFTFGQYKPERVRGAGVWRDSEGILLNDGRKLITTDGKSHEYQSFKSRYVYIQSSTQFGELNGHEATEAEGMKLEELFSAHDWARASSAILSMGWALIAPFGGLLQWRPHIWISGRKGSGKSYLMEHLIAPLCGPFAHRGSGKDTEAGIRRALNQDARPVILDEMEPKSKAAREKIASILELARNASSDGSGMITIAGGDGGTQTFVIRSCFAFASVQIPDEDAAVNSRILRMELKTAERKPDQFRRVDALYRESMADPSRYMRRTYRALSRIISDTQWVRTTYVEFLGEQRKADQIAPLVSAAWAARSQNRLQDDEDGKAWLKEILADYRTTAMESLEDEDQVIHAILAAQIRGDDNKIRTVSELLGEAEENQNGDGSLLLQRHGIRFFIHIGAKYLAIAVQHPEVAKMLRGTPYESGYAAQLKRHKFFQAWLGGKEQTETPGIKMAGKSTRSCILYWKTFKEYYMADFDEDKTSEEDPPF